MKLDDFPTPNDVIDQCLSKIVRPTYRMVLEPAAGDGRICKALKEKVPTALIHAVEIQQKHKEALEKVCNNVTIGDFLTRDNLGLYDLIITNPPYSMAEEYVHKCLRCLEPYGQLVLLLRLGFLESQGRWKRLWSVVDNRPSKVCVLAKRPSFSGDGATDATAYCWMVWDKLYGTVSAPLVFWMSP
jgi:16S rRNA G1207 methylase RsmC